MNTAHKIKCPVCGGIERANVKGEDLVMCSHCLMRRCIALEQAEKRAREESQPLPHEKAVRHPKQPANPKRTCKQCGGGFRPRSNRQEFCSACAVKNLTKKNRDRQSDYREKVQNGKNCENDRVRKEELA